MNPKKLNPFTNLLWDNWIFMVAVLAIAAVQYASCFYWIGDIFEASTLQETQDFSICVALGATVLASAIGFKYMPEKYA